MADLVVIVPSRGRPEEVALLAREFAATCTADTWLMVVVDDSDPALSEYKTAVEDEQVAGRNVGYGTGATTSMVHALNSAAAMLIDEETQRPPFAIGFMGDDHRPRTQGWDQAYLDALRELGTGIVYGNDLWQGQKLPTQVAMTSDIVRELGHMAPPPLRHMYVDNYWLDLGRACGCVRYLPDVVVEHMHPVAGKSEWTEGHKRVNDRSVYRADESAYARYLVSQFPGDVAKVRALRSAR